MHDTFANALKAFRRGVHVHQGEWHGLVMCHHAPKTLEVAWYETERTLSGSSLAKDLKVSKASRTMTFSNGATLRFCVVDTLREVDMRLLGLEFTHVIYVNMNDQPDIAYNAAKYLKSTVVPPEGYNIHVTQL